MEARCLLCDQPMPATGAPTAAIASPPGDICPACAALSPEERRVLRDEAMTRMLRRPIDE
jgi:hypothetical protein